MLQLWINAGLGVVYWIGLAIQILIAWNLIYPMVLLAIRKVRKTEPVFTSSAQKDPFDHAIIITAYQQTDQIRSAVQSALDADLNEFMIYVVADNCETSDLLFDDQRIMVLKPEDVIANNIGSHLFAISNFRRAHTHITIIDSDNLIHPAYFKEVEDYLNAGFAAVQGRRSPKNLETNIACLDAARDIYYHFYDGKILFEAGSSATLSGSGMTFEKKLYEDLIQDIRISGAGFDKVVQYRLVKNGYRIAYATEAIVFDEKTSRKDQLVEQRARWIHTWFKYFGFGFALIKTGLRESSWNSFLFGITLVRPPLFIFLILSVICLIINLWISPAAFLFWIVGLLLFISGFFIAMIKSKADPRIISALRGIPQFMLHQVRSLITLRSKKPLSVATRRYNKLSGSENFSRS